MRLLPRGSRPTVLVALALLVVGCAPTPVTAEGDRVKALYDLFMVIAAVVFVVVAGLIGWSILRYRGTADDELPPQTHHNVALELVWWAIPTILVIGLFVLSAGVLGEVDEPADEGALTIRVSAFQWGWRFAYTESGVTVVGLPGAPAEVHLPVGREVTFLLTSPDVVHSFYVPRFLLKRDVVPGRENRIDATVTDEGTYRGVCGEFCGLLHEQMTFSIVAEPADAFEAWLDEQAGGEG